MKDQVERLPLATVAQKMNTTALNVLMHIKRGILEGVEEEGTWMIDQKSLETLISKTGGAKVENVCASGCAKAHACSGDCS